jgi:hypothetical protein
VRMCGLRAEAGGFVSLIGVFGENLIHGYKIGRPSRLAGRSEPSKPCGLLRKVLNLKWQRRGATNNRANFGTVLSARRSIKFFKSNDHLSTNRPDKIWRND